MHKWVRRLCVAHSFVKAMIGGTYWIDGVTAFYTPPSPALHRATLIAGVYPQETT